MDLIQLNIQPGLKTHRDGQLIPELSECFSLVHGLNGNCCVRVRVLCACRGLLTIAVIHEEVSAEGCFKERHIVIMMT